MKKRLLLLITLIIMICVVCTACAEPENEVKSGETTVHTLPPTEVITVEPEWAEVDCDIALVDSEENIVVTAEDFETFAVIGADDSTSYIAIKVSDEATSMINAMSSTDLSLKIEGKFVEKDSIPTTNFTGEIEIGHDMSYQELCELATTIRGLFN